MLITAAIAFAAVLGLLYCIFREVRKTAGMRNEVSALKKQVVQLSAKAELLSLAGRVSSLGTWEYFPEQELLNWSEELYRIYGIEDRKSGLTVAASEAYIVPEYREKVSKELQSAIRNQSAFAVEYQIMLSSGIRKYVLAQGFYMVQENKLVGTLQDITQQKEAVLKLKINETLLREAEMVSHNGSWEWIEDREFLLWSDEMYNIHGFLPHSVFVSLPWYASLVHEEDQRFFARDFLAALKTKRSFRTSYRIVRPSGEIRYVLSTAEYRKIGLNDFAYIGNTQDVTELRKAQVQLEEKVTELNRSNQELEQFAYVASHDLQEPLRKIKAFGERLKALLPEQENTEAVDYLERMGNAAERMRILINDLLAFSRATRAHRDFIPLELGVLLREVLQSLDYTIEQQQAKVELKAEQVIDGIQSQLYQLFMNLLGNALKFTVPGRLPEISIVGRVIFGHELETGELVPGAQYAELSIRDNGIGFDAEDAGRIFDIFHRLNPRAEYSGTGIGLAICKKIADNHSGLIRAEGQKGKGAVFTVFLPVKQTKRNQ